MTTMRPIRETIPLEEAIAMVAEATATVDRVERVPLREAGGRVIAEAVAAPTDVPPFDRAAMDGYAVIAADTFGAGRYEPTRAALHRNRIHGTAPDETSVGRRVHRDRDRRAAARGSGRRGHGGRNGEGIERRDSHPYAGLSTAARRPARSGHRRWPVVLAPGELLNPSRIGALAATGATDVDVYERPRVAILSTGNEVVAPGQPLGPGQIYDINQFTLSAVIQAHGGTPVVKPTAPDDLRELTEAVLEAASEDLLVFSGGSSVGERDLIMDVLQGSGEVLFHGIAVKPGKPTVFGRVNGRPVLGMPGYPTSCLSNAYMLLVPMLRRMARLPEYRPQTMRAPLSRRIVSTTGRHQFYTVRIVDGAAVPAFKASGDITSMSLADGYIEISPQTDIVEAGEMVEVKFF